MLPPHYAILAAAVQEQMTDNIYQTKDLPPHCRPSSGVTHGTQEMISRGCVCTACRQASGDGV